MTRVDEDHEPTWSTLRMPWEIPSFMFALGMAAGAALEWCALGLVSK